jgi:hypothetical protein
LRTEQPPVSSSIDRVGSSTSCRRSVPGRRKPEPCTFLGPSKSRQSPARPTICQVDGCYLARESRWYCRWRFRAFKLESIEKAIASASNSTCQRRNISNDGVIAEPSGAHSVSVALPGRGSSSRHRHLLAGGRFEQEQADLAGARDRNVPRAADRRVGDRTYIAGQTVQDLSPTPNCPGGSQ